MNQILDVILIGAGLRGVIYTDFMLKMPEKYRVVAVAEPIESRRRDIQRKHGIPDDRCFSDYMDLFGLGKIADLAIISTMDRQHYAPTMEAISLGYDILLEKPVSPSPEECIAISDYARENGVKVVVCHVLRYTELFTTLKHLIQEGRLGEIIAINHEECVGNLHQSHSYVRGNWGNMQRSANMLLAKSCHDMDILQWLLDKQCLKVQSFGSLRFFREENAPDGVPDYCIDGCPEAEKCYYNAVKLYLDDKENDWFRTACTRQANPTDAMVEQSLRTTQYGKCVFKCDNDVVDHQTVNLLFEDGVTAVFTMSAFNKGGRFIHIMGTKGELRAAMDEQTPITLYDFQTKETTTISMIAKDGITGGHGGGDEGIINTLYAYLHDDIQDDSISDIAVSVQSHMIAFAAEKSRADSSVVSLQDYCEEIREKNACRRI